ncbi:putative exported protein [Halobacteriovorax marinus SJ]|uniref:Exported protein n=1 Tax=Halobacteriovorax marinus (strain ATCC BAA-682 / DSM 15412 / SJ) TaxID=862908 RepID=E1X1X4_HALMS|nr:hypothetical protein [Halobacteriovorax marinus]CBW26634.1 putative exported protein [Halobacteriovorax marinus SJ]
MIFSKRIYSLILVATLTASCSFGVKDKKENSNTNALQLSSFSKVSSQNLISASSGINQAAEDVRFTLRACLKDPTGVRNLNAKTVTISGIGGSLQTDASGCVTWSEVKKIDYSKVVNCKEETRTLSIPEEGTSVVLKYAIDPTENTFTDLTKVGAKGCQNENNSALTKNDMESKLILDEVKLAIKANSTIHKRSDTKYQEYQMEFSSCLYARRTEAAIKNRNIEVTFYVPEIEETNKINVETNHKGCFKYRTNTKYEQHNYSHWMNAKFTAKVLEGPLAEEEVETGLLLNPWDNDLVDQRFGKAQENPLKETSRFQINGVMYILIGNNVNNFSVNEHLNLTVSKTYQIVLNPRIDRGHRFNTPRFADVEGGRFKLKFMILAPNNAEMEIDKNNFENFTYITGAEKEVEVVNGTINTLIDLPIKVSDMPRMALRTVSVFKLEPIDKEIGLRQRVVTGFFKAKIPWIKTNVMSNDALNESSTDSPSTRYTPEAHQTTTGKVNNSILEGEVSASDFFDVENLTDVEKNETDIQAKQFKNYIEYLFDNLNLFTEERAFTSKFKQSSKDIYIAQKQATTEKFKMLSISEAQELLKTKKLENRLIYIAKEFKKTGKFNLLSSGKTSEEINAFKKSLCTLALGEKNSVQPAFLGGTKPSVHMNSCMKDPQAYMNLEVKRHVDTVEKVNPKYSNGFNFSVGSRFSIYEGQSTSEYTSIRSGIDAAVKIPFGEFFGLGIRLFDISKGVNYSTNENQSFGDDVSESKSIGVEKFAVDVTAKYNHCLLISPKTYTTTSYSNYSYRYGGSYGGVKNTTFDGNTYYMCSRPYEDTLEESWYYLQSFTSGTSYFRDSFGPTEIKLIKVIRGYKNYLKFRDALRDETKQYLYVDSTGIETPDNKVYDNWKHLINEDEGQTKGDVVNLVIDNTEGSLPGTIE